MGVSAVGRLPTQSGPFKQTIIVEQFYVEIPVF